MEQEIIEGNKLIAEFMGYKIWYIDGNQMYIETSPEKVEPIIEWAKYHTSWDWLMPVVEKIESMETEFDGHFGVHIISNGCTISGTRLNTSIEHPHYAYFNNIVNESKISATWLAVVEFIKWYNQNKK